MIDTLHTQIDRLETKVVKPLVEYDSVCRKARVSFTFQHGLSSLAIWPSALITCRRDWGWLMAKNKGYVPHKTLLHSSGGAEEQPQCWGERGNQTEKLGPCEDQGPSKQEEDCIHQSPCTNHTHRVISILAHSSPNAHMHHSPNTHLFQSSSPTTPRFLFWFESSSSLMVTFLG